MSRYFNASCLACILSFLVLASVLRAGESSTISMMLGGGNFDNGKVADDTDTKIRILQALHMKRCLVNLYPGAYLAGIGKWNEPGAGKMDALMEKLHAGGIEPVLLFEYYTDYYEKEGFGTEKQWEAIGRAFAERYAPGGTWAKERNLENYGVRLYTAINEPEPKEFRLGGKLGPKPYVAALRGLSRGVKSVNKELDVAPAGFMAANAWDDWTLRGLGPALAPLFNDGTLDGIDLHTYYDVQWAPMKNGFSNSAMHNFLMVKRASGITADIEFYATEWNHKFRDCSREQAAAGVFTGLFDHVGVVGNDGRMPVARIALPWNVFQDADKVKQFGMSESNAPYKPSPRGATLQRALGLIGDLTIAASDPLGTGMMVLTGEDRTVWVWQNRKGWTDRPGTEITLHGVPTSIKEIQVYGWDGERKRVTAGTETLTVTDLPEGETLLFVAEAKAAAGGAALLPPDAYRIRPELRAEEKQAADLTGSTRLQETFDEKDLTGWSAVPASAADVSAKLMSDVLDGAAGRCAKMQYAFVKKDKQTVPSTWRMQSGRWASEIKRTPGENIRIAFTARCTQQRRPVRILIYDRDNETFATETTKLSPAWKTVSIPLTEKDHWGGNPGNDKIDWPIRMVGVEVLNWGGASDNGSETLWLDDLRLLVDDPAAE